MWRWVLLRAVREVLAVAVTAAVLVLPALVGTAAAAPLLPGGGAAAPASTAVAAEPVVGVVQTKITWVRRTASLTYGLKSLLEGQVIAYVDEELPGFRFRYSKPLKNAPVELLARPVGSNTWKRVATRTTNSETVAMFRFDGHKPVRNTDYKVVYRGESIYAASSATTRVNVWRVIASSLRANSDGTATLRGTVAPKVAGRTVRLQRKTCSSCSWSTLKSTKTSSTSRWSFRITRPSTGAWYYRVYTPKDSHFLTSYSGKWTVRRR